MHLILIGFKVYGRMKKKTIIFKSYFSIIKQAENCEKIFT